MKDPKYQFEEAENLLQYNYIALHKMGGWPRSSCLVVPSYITG